MSGTRRTSRAGDYYMECDTCHATTNPTTDLVHVAARASAHRRAHPTHDIGTYLVLENLQREDARL